MNDLALARSAGQDARARDAGRIRQQKTPLKITEALRHTVGPRYLYGPGLKGGGIRAALAALGGECHCSPVADDERAPWRQRLRVTGRDRE